MRIISIDTLVDEEDITICVSERGGVKLQCRKIF